ncbi:MAG: xanthine phosphoribosyltransferase [Candidatus Obscuribacter sp.]|jgi:xanthine phosphoribosyltransferase|nr:xanthine phosphoribosyltransferase [Candidatus Obscuribacter sp.]MDQ5966632.1 xanthine phosphoribosyltransferase [Cyanobacteriota bacterium erpe_2018_sw_39hr_WHONDRS-SW48-000098_B_bin.30]MBK9617568.1 xanthine phosphoribosyltransferase [Candidatus Obscuribacter sp.]MBK9773760.1 xanthine phosphoribosyltransferase [Candidatus Obscuribacter sp.]MBL0189109.1 xanthine phosphoribosyltransferase [Candidatus Obscuribacter sp.]
MKRLKDKILSEGKYLGNGILKVDSFMNHQIDPQLMKEVGEEFARRFKDQNPTRILTAESSGIAPALSAALVLGVPLVFARKHQPVTMAQNPFKESAMSHTKGNMVELIVSPEYLFATDRVLILDDFLASARTIKALVKLVQASGATLVGIGAVIEKAFEGGRNEVSNLGVPVESLAAIASFDGDKVVFRE